MGGASVSYVAPLSHDQARRAFETVAAEVEQGRRLVVAAYSGGDLVGTGRGQGAGDPDGRACDATVFWKALSG